jgi:acetyl-CoA acyltransferase
VSGYFRTNQIKAAAYSFGLLRPCSHRQLVDLIELNEAFAAQMLACLRELPIDPDKLNVNGGAIALGHPLGCTGAKLTTTLLYEMRRRNAQYGLVTMCVGGGMGAAGIFERL